jgi:hypothetical protein
MARTKQTSRKPTAGKAPGVSIAQQKVNNGKMIVPPGYIVKRSKKTGKKYLVKDKINPMPIKPYRQPAGTLIDGEIVFLWHHEKPSELAAFDRILGKRVAESELRKDDRSDEDEGITFVSETTSDERNRAGFDPLTNKALVDITED